MFAFPAPPFRLSVWRSFYSYHAFTACVRGREMSSGHGIAGMLRCARPNHAHAAVRRYGDAHLSEHERDRPRVGQRETELGLPFSL